MFLSDHLGAEDVLAKSAVVWHEVKVLDGLAHGAVQQRARWRSRQGG